jgi:putative flippase GtrA
MSPINSSEVHTAPDDRLGLAASAGILLSRHQHLLRYLLIGASASALDVILFVALYNQFGLSELAAQAISVTCAVIFSFVTNARHNFKVSDRMAMRLTSFILVCAFGGALGYGVILGAMAVGLDANAGKLLSLPVVFVAQYVLNSRITFRRASTPR